MKSVELLKQCKAELQSEVESLLKEIKQIDNTIRLLEMDSTESETVEIKSVQIKRKRHVRVDAFINGEVVENFKSMAHAYENIRDIGYSTFCRELLVNGFYKENEVLYKRIDNQ